ncbi:MAG: putative quinol monooxygenase [Pseudomonadales bacterium]
MIIVSAKITFASEQNRDEAITLSTPIQQLTRDQEPGCHAYCFAPDPCEATAIQVYELWEDGDSLIAHFDHANYQSMLEMLSQVGFVESVNRAYLTERNEPVYGPNFEKKTAFFE